MNLVVISKFIDCVKNDELRTMLVTHCTPLTTKAPRQEELRLKSKEISAAETSDEISILQKQFWKI